MIAAPVNVTVPPVIVVLCTPSLLPFAEIVPPVFVIPVSESCGPMFSNNSVDPAVASIVPVFVIPPFALIVIPADPFELIVPEFTSVNCPLPMCPAPEIVSWLVSVSVAAAPNM
jgi:hypothetical protein